MLVGGILVAVLGGVFMLLGRTPINFGNLPGDIRIQRENMSCFFPISSMIVISIILTILLNIIIRLFNR